MRSDLITRQRYPALLALYTSYKIFAHSRLVRPGQNTIERKSTESSVTIPFERTFRNLEENRPIGGDNLDQFNFCGCGWPQHMLVPKGNKEGFPMDLFIMISDYTGDAVSTFYTYRALLRWRLRAYGVSGDGNPSILLSPLLPPSLFFSRSNDDVPGAREGVRVISLPKRIKMNKRKKKKEQRRKKKREKRKPTKGIALPFRGVA